MVVGSVISAMTRNLPPHRGQIVISISNTRLSLCAQVSGAMSASCSGVPARHGSAPGGAWVWALVQLPPTT